MTSPYQQGFVYKKVMSIKVPVEPDATKLPPLPTTGHVTDVTVQNLPGNSSSIKVMGVSIPPGGVWTWGIPAAGYELDPTQIDLDLGGQPISVYYNYVDRKSLSPTLGLQGRLAW